MRAIFCLVIPDERNTFFCFGKGHSVERFVVAFRSLELDLELRHTHGSKLRIRFGTDPEPKHFCSLLSLFGS